MKQATRFENLSTTMQNDILSAQRNEITEYHLYKKLEKATKDAHNKKILANIAADEMRHYAFFKGVTKQDVNPQKWKIWKYYIIARLFGKTFGIMLMEQEEEKAQKHYQKIYDAVPGVKEVIADEQEHEKKLIGMLHEEKLRYVGSIVLGLNDALVELTGALAGFTLALQNTRMIAVVGFITGVAASFSMAASEYLSIKSEGQDLNPIKAAFYTGFAYLLVVFFLIFPYILLSNVYACLAWTLLNATIVIFVFTYYTSVAKNLPFSKRFFEMIALSFGVAILTFGIGFLVRTFLDIDAL